MSNDDENKTKQNPRLVSLDALRGFDMFWIIGGVPLVSALLALLGLEKIRSAFLQQMHHVPWDGFHAEDLIFPLFLFIAGVTMPFSIGRQIERGDDQWRINLKIPNNISKRIFIVKCADAPPKKRLSWMKS